MPYTPRTLVGMLCLLTALVAGAPARAADPAPVLAQVAADAPVVFVVPNLTTLNDKIKMVANVAGVTVPEQADMLAQLKAITRMDKGLDDNGSFAIVVTDPTFAADAQGAPPIIMLVPVTDYAAFLGNFGATGAPDQVTQLTMPNNETGYSKLLGSHAVVGPDQARVQAYAGGNATAAMVAKAGAFGGGLMTSTDAFVYADIQMLAPTLNSMIDQGAAQMQAEVANNPQAAAALPLMEMYFDAARAVVRDSDAAVIGLGADELGVGLSKAFQFRADTELAKMFGPGQSAKAQLDRLPDGAYLIASGIDLRGLPLKTVVNAVIAKMEAVPEMAGVIGMIKPSLAIIDKAQGMAQLVGVPQQGAMMAGGLFAGVSVIESDDAAGLLKTYRESLETLNGKSVPLAGVPAADPNAPPPAISYATTYTPNALQIDGLSVDQYSMQMNLPPELMQNNPMAPMLAMMGVGNTTGYLAATDKYVVVTTTPDAAAVRNVIAAAKGASPGLGSNAIVSQVRQQLTPEPIAEGYLSMSGLLTMYNTFGGMFGLPVVQVPDDLPPIGMSMSSKDASLAGRLYVPMAVIKAGADLAAQVQGMMQQPAPAQGGQGEGPPPAPF